MLIGKELRKEDPHDGAERDREAGDEAEDAGQNESWVHVDGRTHESGLVRLEGCVADNPDHGLTKGNVTVVGSVDQRLQRGLVEPFDRQ